MKKRFLRIAALAMATMMLFTACGPANNGPSNGSENQGNGGADLSGTYDITIWVSETEGVAALTQEQIDKFEAANPGIVINATIEGVTEADSATKMITSVEDGADIYCFAQDQLARLVMAGALAELGEGASKLVSESNDAGAVKAASVGGKLYCYPLTSDNGYYMYYDKSVIKEEHLDSLEDIIKDCEDAGKMFSYDLAGNGWYNAGFFFATGCVSEWTTGADGKFTSVNDNFNSEAGLIALKGMQKILQSKAYVGSANASDFAAAIPSAVVISGPWCSADVQKILGDNYGATDLPSFTVDGKSYHIGSFSGNKLMGVKPSTDNVKTAVLHKLAQFLTNEACSLERFNLVGWGPSNLAAQKNDAVQNSEHLSALALQSAYAIPQGQIHGSWWDIAKAYAVAAQAATTEDELKAALKAYQDSIDGLFELTEDELNAWSVIGSICGTNWDTDFAMKADGEGVYVSEVLDLKAGEEYKCRQGASWDNNFGADGHNGANCVVEADGKYIIKLTITGEKEGTIELIAQ